MATPASAVPAIFTPASLDYLRHLAVSAGILLALVAFILFQATAPRYSSTPRLSTPQARRAWALFGLLVLVAVLVVCVLWWAEASTATPASAAARAASWWVEAG